MPPLPSHSSRTVACIAVLFALLPVRGYAQGRDEADTDGGFGAIVVGDLGTALRDGAKLFTCSVYDGPSEEIYAAATACGTATLFLADEEIRSRTAGKNASFADVVTAHGDVYGSYAGPVVGLALYAGGLFTGDRAVRVTGRVVLETVVYSGLISVALKSILGRARPQTARGHATFKPFTTTDDDYLSLPSGHATMAFALSTALAGRVDRPIVSVVLYAAAAGTAYHRLYHDRHWTSDVFLGAAIGFGVGTAMNRLEDARAGGNDRASAFFLQPVVLPGGAGVVLGLRF